MPYEIPQNLKYQEKIIFGLTFPQLIWIGLFAGSGALIFLKAPLELYFRAAISGILVLLGFGFAFMNLAQHILTFRTYRNSLREAGYLDKRANSFVEVKKVENDSIYLKTGGMRAVLQIIPINFSILSEAEQRAIISAYRDFLNSLDFPVQIVMRTVNLSLDSYMNALRSDVEKTKNEGLIEQFNSFQEFVKGFIEKNAVKNRLFYIVVPYSASYSRNFLKDVAIGIGNLSREKKGKTSYELNKETALNQLDVRVKLCIEKLKKCSLITQRLNSEQLVSLLASFFGEFVEAQNDYFFPLTLLGEFKASEAQT